MVSIYDFSDYRNFLNTWISSQRGVRGLQGKLADSAGVSSSLISLILRGEKHLSLEQAVEIAEYVGLVEHEIDYFFLLVELGRAGSAKLKKQLTKRVEEQRKKLGNRITRQTELSDEVKSVYYSSWVYSGVRNLTAVQGFQDIQSIAQRLSLSPAVVGAVAHFLLENGLCKNSEVGLTYGPQKTHVPADSPFVVRHHQNWRLQGFQKMEERKEQNTFFTSPMSLSREAAREVSGTLPKVIKQIMDISGPSDSEVVYCFNMDWFEY